VYLEIETTFFQLWVIFMTKEKTKTTANKSTNDSISKNVEKENKKDNTPPTPSPDSTSTNDQESGSDPSDSASTVKKTYVRGESQKPVTKAYRNNWNSIFKKG